MKRWQRKNKYGETKTLIITLFATVLMCIVFTACTSAVDSSFNYAEIVDDGAWEGAVDRKNSPSITRPGTNPFRVFFMEILKIL